METSKAQKSLNRVLLIVGAVAVAEWWIRVTLQINERGDDAFFIDFVAFWAGAKLALQGQAMAVWDQAAFALAQAAPRAEGTQMPWFYPPTWQMAMVPYGLLPFSVAWGVFIVISLALYMRALWRVNPSAWIGLTVCPTVLLTMMLGNNSVLFAGCLALALNRMGRLPRKGVLSGLLIAALSMKPGLGPLIPVALMAGGRWRVILWATIGTLTLATLATLTMGMGHWQAFFDGLGFAINRVVPGSKDAAGMVSWYALAQNLGLDDAAMVLHLALLAVAAVLLVLVWRRGAAAFDWAAAMLMIGVALTSPHAFHYELVFAMAGFAFALRAGLDWGGKLILALLWLAPLQLLLPVQVLPTVLIASPVASAAFLYCAWRGLRA